MPTLSEATRVQIKALNVRAAYVMLKKLGVSGDYNRMFHKDNNGGRPMIESITLRVSNDVEQCLYTDSQVQAVIAEVKNIPPKYQIREKHKTQGGPGATEEHDGITVELPIDENSEGAQSKTKTEATEEGRGDGQDQEGDGEGEGDEDPNEDPEVRKARKAAEKMKRDAEQMEKEAQRKKQEAAERLEQAKQRAREMKQRSEAARRGERFHKQFDELLCAIRARDKDGHRLNVYLMGPAGTGKTTSAKQAAAMEGLDFRGTGSMSTEFQVQGYTDAMGRLVTTQFRESWADGKMFCADEMDGSLAPAILALNAGLANGFMAFPDGIVHRHGNFCFVGTGNTALRGATAGFSARVKMDEASVDRFVFIEWQIDEELERHFADNKAWVDRVQHVRRVARDRGMNHVITPRATVQGEALLKAGMPLEKVEVAVLKRGISDEQWDTLKAA